MPGQCLEFDPGLSLTCGRTSNFPNSQRRIRVQKQNIKNPYQNGAVNSFGENELERGDFGKTAGTAVNSFRLKSVRNLGFSGPFEAARDCWEQENGGGRGIRTPDTFR